MTNLQTQVYNFEVEISGEEFADGEINNIRKLKKLNDVKEYYLYNRGWIGDESLLDCLLDFIIRIKMS